MMRDTLPELRFYNTLSRTVEPFQPEDPTHVRLYVCGPTVYDEAHLGHARCYITWDVLYRFLRFAGYNVTYVRNITDVDDKILKRAAENHETPTALAERFTERFETVMGQLNVQSPSQEPKATAHVGAMITLIQKLIADGYAYVAPSGTVYYDTAKKADYGNLCHQNLDDLQSGARVEVTLEKKSPLDFALWKPASPDEPLVWPKKDEKPIPWEGGKPGRPGWHIECSAMSWKLLGDQLDIHAGGMDLIFPHHQNEIAQSEAFTGKAPFVKLWMHNGFVNVSGEKMSKSLGNFATVAKLLERYDANTIRYFILQHHYRSPMDFNDEALEGPRNWVRKVTSKIKEHLKAENIDPSVDYQALTQQALQNIFQERLSGVSDLDGELEHWFNAMANDLNTPQALSSLQSFYSRAFQFRMSHMSNPEERLLLLNDEEKKAKNYFLGLSQVMGFDFITLALSEPDLSPIEADLHHYYYELQPNASLPYAPGSVEAALEAIIAYRTRIREEKNWALSDQIRDRLAALGISLKDNKDKTTTWTYEPVTTAAAP